MFCDIPFYKIPHTSIRLLHDSGLGQKEFLVGKNTTEASKFVLSIKLAAPLQMLVEGD